MTRIAGHLEERSHTEVISATLMTGTGMLDIAYTSGTEGALVAAIDEQSLNLHELGFTRSPPYLNLTAISTLPLAGSDAALTEVSFIDGRTVSVKERRAESFRGLLTLVDVTDRELPLNRLELQTVYYEGVGVPVAVDSSVFALKERHFVSVIDPSRCSARWY